MNLTRALFVVLALSLTACSVDKSSMSIFLAKETCSCKFLVGRSTKDCKKDASLTLLFGDLTIDEENKSVTATAEDKSNPATARFVSEKFGCEVVL